MCGCGKGGVGTRTVYRVIYPDGSRSADFARESDAHSDNAKRDNTGRVVSAQV